MVPASPARACGIDFGTSNSTAGWLRPGHPTMLPLEEGKPTLPSVVFFNAEENSVSFGRAGLREYLDGYEGRLMRSLKSLLGSRLIDGRTEVQGRVVGFRDLLAQFIATLKARAEQQQLYLDAIEPERLDRLLALIRQRAGHWLAHQVEQAKIALSASDTATLTLERFAPRQQEMLTRAEFDLATQMLVQKVEATVARLLAEAGVAASSIDTVFFTGGSSGIPLLRRRIAALLPEARVVEGDLFGSIGAGLAVDAARRYGTGKLC